MIELLIDPLTQYGFMRLGLAAAVTVGVTSAVLSCLLVVRHQALLGDAISHAVLLGVAVGYLFAQTAGIFWGALVVAVATGTLITWVERHSPVKLDAVMGIVFTATFALGLTLISITKPRGIDLFHILFGNVLGVSGSDLALTVASGVTVLLVVLVRFRAFHLWSFDPLMARAIGMRVGVLEYLLTGLLSATIVAALQAVGLILVIAMLITPGAAALLLTTRLRTMMLVAAVVGMVSAVGGLYLSFYVDVASGPAIVLVATGAFAMALVFAPRRGLFARALHRRRAARRVLREDLLKELFDHDDPDAVTPLADVGRWLRARSSNLRSLRRLARRGLVSVRADGACLTAAGKREALRMVRTHRLLERYAHDADGVALPQLHDVAERREHEIDAAGLRDIDRLLGAPRVDPHGHPIPSRAGELRRIAGGPLSARPVGVAGRVAMVGDDRSDLLERMVTLGILPDRRVTVLCHTDEGPVVRVGDDDVLCVSDDLAERVYVVSGDPDTPTAPDV